MQQETVNPMDRELMEQHVAALYRLDRDGAMVSINDWLLRPAPRFYLGRTHGGNVWHFHRDLPTATALELSKLCETEPTTADGPPVNVDAYLGILGAAKGYGGPAYWFPEPIPPADDCSAVTEANASLLTRNFSDWLPDVPHQQPFFACMSEGSPVALCASVRTTDQAVEAGVETISGHRQRGFGKKVVATWADAVQAQDKRALYSTSDDNLASQRLAIGLGAMRYGTDFHVI